VSDRHHAHWPAHLPGRHLTLPQTHLYRNVEVSALRYPDKPFLVFYGAELSFARFRDESERLAGTLQRECGVARGDRVLLFMQNCPQFAIGFYAILRADAVVVPVNPMNLTLELEHFVTDSGAKVAIVAQELYAQMAPLIGKGLERIIVAAYSDYLPRAVDGPAPPAFVTEPRQSIGDSGVTLWGDAIESGHTPEPIAAGPDDLAVMPYTSGTTGRPKGCMHTHRGVMYNTIGTVNWFGGQQDGVFLATLPFFHVTGMQGSMNAPLYLGATVIVLPRWDRIAVADAIERHGVTNLHMITAMVVDLLADPEIGRYDLSSLRRVGGGGASMPEAVAQRMHEVIGLPYFEGYGMSETIAPTHLNPPQNPKKQCLGIPMFDVDSRVVDPETLAELPPGEVGEIIVSGPQVMLGYWGDVAATHAAFVTIDGKRFLRTGDLGTTDADGYFFMVDRLKRMINAAGFKVWPAEVESLLYHHPAIQEACVIAARDEKRGETVKAVIVLRAEHAGKVSEQEIIDWARTHMAAYKAPRIIEFAESIPKSGAGKVQWRVLQEREFQKTLPCCKTTL